MERLTIAGSTEAVPASEIAAQRYRVRLEEVRVERGDDGAAAFETLIGRRITVLVDGGLKSIDVATMRALLVYAETPPEPEDEGAGGLGKAMRGLRERWEQRGGPLGG